MSDRPTPETEEAIERWRQGKINIFDQMSRLKRERDEGKELGASTVRHYIVQERYRDIPKSPQWWDDPEQAAGTERTPELAAGWLAKDCRECKGHAEAYEHQIIERTERVYHPASDVDRMLSLPNNVYTHKTTK